MKDTRMTNQRLRILEYLKSVRSHPTAEMVFEEVLKDLPAITLATVYRNLNLLAEQGKILRFVTDKEYRYDGFSHSHIHLVCKKCGQILDADNDKIFNLLKKGISKENFSPDSANIIIYGVCKKCKKGE